ncbi:transportin [Cystoisospora suis]|uniref:Transportin n=1 Tax=Cystoisospora suis TaxID=483139 RepID=A0A2C6KIB6_9APIC|nr:transportin [Cystoisospora suis]
MIPPGSHHMSSPPPPCEGVVGGVSSTQYSSSSTTSPRTNPEGNTEVVLQMLHALYSGTDHLQRSQADSWLRQWQKSPDAWESCLSMLSNHVAVLSSSSSSFPSTSTMALNQPQSPSSSSQQYHYLSDECVYFLTQTLRTKTMFDFHQLPAESHETLCAHILRLIQELSFHSSKATSPDAGGGGGEMRGGGRDRYRAALTQLSLCMADLALQTANKWVNPVQVLIQAFPKALSQSPWVSVGGADSTKGGPYAVAGSPSEGGDDGGNEREGEQRLLLLLLQHLAEESFNRKVMADEMVWKQHIRNLSSLSSTSLVTQVLLHLRQEIKERKANNSHNVISTLAMTSPQKALQQQQFHRVNTLFRAVLRCWKVWIPLFYNSSEGTEAESCFSSTSPPPPELKASNDMRASLALVFSDCFEVLASSDNLVAFQRGTKDSCAHVHQGVSGGGDDDDVDDAAASCITRLLESIHESIDRAKDKLLRAQQTPGGDRSTRLGSTSTCSNGFSSSSSSSCPPSTTATMANHRSTEGERADAISAVSVTLLRETEEFEKELLSVALSQCTGPLRNRLGACISFRRKGDEGGGGRGNSLTSSGSSSGSTRSSTGSSSHTAGEERSVVSEESVLPLIALSRVYTRTGLSLIPQFLTHIHDDGQLQQLLQILISLVEIARTAGLIRNQTDDLSIPLAPPTDTNRLAKRVEEEGGEDEDDDYDGPGVGDAILIVEEPLRFFTELGYAVLDSFNGNDSCQVGVDPKSHDALREVYVHLVRECLRQLVLPRSIYSTGDISGDSEDYRYLAFDLLEVSGAVLSVEGLSLLTIDELEKVLIQIQQQQGEDAIAANPSLLYRLKRKHERFLEGYMTGVGKALSWIHDYTRIQSRLSVPISAVSAILTTEDTITRGESVSDGGAGHVLAKIAAVYLISRLLPAVKNDTHALQQILQMLVRQLLVTGASSGEGALTRGGEGEERGNSTIRRSTPQTLQRLQLDSARALRELCCKGSRASLQDLVDELVQLTLALARMPTADDDVQVTVLEGVASVTGKLTDTPTFLRVLSALCEPAIEGLRQTEGLNENAICRYLDHIAVVLRDAVIPGVTSGSSTSSSPSSSSSSSSSGAALFDEDRRTRVSSFITTSLWPLLQQGLCTFPRNQRIIEKALRCLKHGVRSAGPHFKSELPQLLHLIQANSQIELHCTYLYAAEWLAMEYGNDSQFRQMLLVLFQHLSQQALQTIEKQGNEGKIDACCDLVEDCYGMMNRYIRYCPLLVSLSPQTIQQALTVARVGVYVQQKEAAQVVFIFLDSCTYFCGCDGVTGEEEVRSLSNAVKPVVLEFLPVLIEEVFRLLATAPPRYVVRLIEEFLSRVSKTFGRGAEAWIARKMKALFVEISSDCCFPSILLFVIFL